MHVKLIIIYRAVPNLLRMSGNAALSHAGGALVIFLPFESSTLPSNSQ